MHFPRASAPKGTFTLGESHVKHPNSPTTLQVKQLSWQSPQTAGSLILNFPTPQSSTKQTPAIPFCNGYFTDPSGQEMHSFAPVPMHSSQVSAQSSQ